MTTLVNKKKQEIAFYDPATKIAWKSAHRTQHQMVTPRAWAIDLWAYHWLRKNGFTMFIIYDQDDKKDGLFRAFQASSNMWEEEGEFTERGTSGKQWRLELKFWTDIGYNPLPKVNYYDERARE